MRGAAAGLMLVAFAVSAGELTPAPRPLLHDAYVWQRTWTPAVAAAVRAAPESGLRGLAVLAAQVAWPGATPVATITDPDYAVLRAYPNPIGLVIRIQEYAAKLERDPQAAAFVATTVRQAIERMQAHGVSVCDVQLDFDCAESRLGVYRDLVLAVKRESGSTPIVVTALPCWLPHTRDLRDLLACTDGFVLQVHSLEPPSGAGGGLSLCRAAPSLAWIRDAAAFGVPFRVALPTYALARSTGAAGGAVVVARSDPDAMADILAGLRAGAPTNLQGIIWFRLPVAGEGMNWAMPTLRALIAGKRPAPRVAAALCYPEAHLVDIDVVNAGDADAQVGKDVQVSWTGAPPVARDVLEGFDLVELTATGMTLRGRGRPGGEVWLGPGERRKAAWLRFDRSPEVTANVQ